MCIYIPIKNVHFMYVLTWLVVVPYTVPRENLVVVVIMSVKRVTFSSVKFEYYVYTPRENLRCVGVCTDHFTSVYCWVAQLTSCIRCFFRWLTVDRICIHTRVTCVVMMKHQEIRKTQTTLSNGYLGSRNDEERSEMRYVMRIAELSESSNLWTQIALLG